MAGRKPSKAKWAEYEKLAHKIMAELLPYATVKLDDHPRGVDSEGPRQIDVSARWTDASGDHLMIVQVKDLARKADVNKVGEFKSVIEDVRASKGILICSGGFSKKAVTYARNLGILLYSLMEANSKHWPSELTIPIIWTRLTPRLSCTGLFKTTREVEAKFLYTEKGLPVLRYSNGDSFDVFAVFEEPWNSGSLDRVPGIEPSISIAESVDMLVEWKDVGRQWLPLRDFRVVYFVEQTSWLGQLSPDDYRGLVDHLDNQNFLPSHIRFDKLPSEPDKEWVKISDPERVALDTPGVLITTEQFKVDPQPDGAELIVSEMSPDLTRSTVALHVNTLGGERSKT